MYALDNVNLAFEAFITKLKTAVEENKKFTISNPKRVVMLKPWIIDNLCNKIKFRQTLYMRSKKDLRNNNLKAHLKIVPKKNQIEINYTKKNFYQSKFSES